MAVWDQSKYASELAAGTNYPGAVRAEGNGRYWPIVS